MEKLYAILGAIAAAIIAILTANRGLVKRQEKKIEILKEKKKDLELKEAVLLDRAKDANKKTIESKEELDAEIKKLRSDYGSTVDDIIGFVERGER